MLVSCSGKNIVVSNFCQIYTPVYYNAGDVDVESVANAIDANNAAHCVECNPFCPINISQEKLSQ